MGPGSTWRLPSNTSSWYVTSDSIPFQTKYMSQFFSYICCGIAMENVRHVQLCRSVGAPVSATQFPADSVWRPASFSSSSLMMSFSISTGEIGCCLKQHQLFWDSISLQHQELLLQWRRVQLRLRTSQGSCWQLSGLRLFEERAMVRSLVLLISFDVP